jgi:hypothetical protein
MKNTFTILEMQQLQKEEVEMQCILDDSNELPLSEPNENAVSAILAYSKALSVRPSKHVDFIELLIN